VGGGEALRSAPRHSLYLLRKTAGENPQTEALAAALIPRVAACLDMLMHPLPPALAQELTDENTRFKLWCDTH